MSQVSNLAKLVSIGITTKNRWYDLYQTLDKIIKADLGEVPLFIIDDNSEQQCPFDINQLGLAGCKIERLLESKGLIVRRNQLANLIATKYYLSLDDDSYPLTNNLNAALEFAESNDDLFCISFPIYNSALAQYQNISVCREPYKVRHFIGCGHLLNIERFLQVGGYCEELLHQGEEMDVAARAFQQGWHCYHFPRYPIVHSASLNGRNWHRMDYYGSRNIVLWNDWFVPPTFKFMKQSRTLVSRLLLYAQVRRLGVIQGYMQGVRDIYKYQASRCNLSVEQYRNWTQLPEC